MIIKNIIWDFDGTIMDTYPAIASSTYMVALNNKVNIDYNEILRMTKITLRFALEFLAKKTLKSYEELFQEYLIEYDKFDSSKLIVFPYVLDILKYVINAGGANYIVTHRGKDSLLKHLKENELTDFFSYIITGDCNFSRKPSPDAFIYLRDKYNLSSQNTIVIGDRLLDVEAGFGAGFQGILYQNNLDFSGKITSINSYKELLTLTNHSVN